jgi:hypothetical protein
MPERPEDGDTTVVEGQGYIGSFPGSSIWPFVLGMGCWLMVLALTFGSWLAVIGVPVISFALAGATAEGRRGGVAGH